MSWKDLAWEKKAYNLVDRIETFALAYVNNPNPIIRKAAKSSFNHYKKFREQAPEWALVIIDSLGIDSSANQHYNLVKEYRF
jgi:hypothetical protein